MAFTLEPKWQLRAGKLAWVFQFRGQYCSSVYSSHLTQCTQLGGTWKTCTAPWCKPKESISQEIPKAVQA